MFYMVKFQLRAEGHAALVVDGIGVAFETREVVVAHRLAEVDEPLRIPEMFLPFLAATVLATGGEYGCRIDMRHET